MATFTMTLKQAIKFETDSENIADISEAIGLGHYPIFDEDYRLQLNKKIVDRYWNQEIGFETVSMFKHYMATRMNEIMPLYNQFYESQARVIDPFKTFDITTLSNTELNATSSGERTQTAENVSEAESITTSKARAIGSDFPQMQLAGNEDYATTGSDTIGETDAGTTGKDESTAQSSDESTSHQAGESQTVVTGYQGSMADMMLRYRQTFMNIDLQIIEELSGLFMSIWNTSETYTNNWSY